MEICEFIAMYIKGLRLSSSHFKRFSTDFKVEIISALAEIEVKLQFYCLHSLRL